MHIIFIIIAVMFAFYFLIYIPFQLLAWLLFSKESAKSKFFSALAVSLGIGGFIGLIGSVVYLLFTKDFENSRWVMFPSLVAVLLVNKVQKYRIKNRLLGEHSPFYDQ